ncbi:hypothetical protein AVEN_181913-1 [Araneus ventricosus]|uniref:Uncharacterized protein n=1 Tax=Araneus ventricosus TaxID=182803 RepID=A0A4Y2RSQ8_ARAVE|nr:hypothetical protein AVEN_181913-1 [Araneus ventricosus]
MGHRTEQVPQREVLVNTPTKRAGVQSGASGLLFSGCDEKGKLSPAGETACDKWTGPKKVGGRWELKGRARMENGRFLEEDRDGARARLSWWGKDRLGSLRSQVRSTEDQLHSFRPLVEVGLFWLSDKALYRTVIFCT